MTSAPAIPLGPAPCAICGVSGPTKYVQFYQNIGMLVARRTISVKQHLCRNCIDRCFRSFTLTTLVLGWWGTISLFITPLILVNNCARYLTALSLERPSPLAVNRPIDAPPPKIDATSRTFKLVYGVIVLVVGLGALAYYHVDFMQEHFPRLNAMMHGGEMAGAEDAKYRGAKWSEDARAILADTKSPEYASYRSEMLSREPYLADLTQQNGAIQSALAEERKNNLGAGDPCEQLSLDEMAPAMDDLTKTETEVFALLHRVPTITDDARSSLAALGQRERSALDRLDAYNADRDKHGCKQ